MIVWMQVAWAHPPANLTCEALAEKLAADPLPERPAAPSYWWLEPGPCPGAKLGGPLPPQARDVTCVDARGDRWGRSTTLDDRFRVLRETRYERDLEIGPRIDWSPLVEGASSWTEYLDDVQHGRAVLWTAGGVVVSWYRKGYRDGPTYKIGPRGEVEFVEYWTKGVRETRSCVWRDGKLAIDHD